MSRNVSPARGRLELRSGTMKLRWLVLACAVCSGWPAPASACSVILPQKLSLACGGGAGGAAHTSVAQARLELGAVAIQRSRYAPPGRGDCGELGSSRLRFQLLDEHGAQVGGSGGWPSDVGLLLTLREGQSGYFAPPPTTVAGVSGWLLLPQAGAVRLFGPDDPRSPLALRLEARAVDCQGAVSAATEVHIAHPGRSDAGPAGPDAALPPASAAGAAGAEPVLANRPAPPGASCAVCSAQGGAALGEGQRSPGPGGLGLALGVLALGVLRRRAQRASPT